MPDPNIVSPDEYKLVRGVPAQKGWIANVERRLEAKLIPDYELALLKELDKNLRSFRLQAMLNHKGPDPKDRRFASKTDFYFYEEIPIPVGIYLSGMPTVQTHNVPTPAWFRVRRNLNQKPGDIARLKGILLS